VTATSLNFFDALIPSVLGVASKHGLQKGGEVCASSEEGGSIVWIKKRAEESWEGIAICDSLREALILPPLGDPEGQDPSGSAEALILPNRFGDLYSMEERREFLFRAARWVVGGGAMCQYEDEWTPYAAAVRDIARDFLTVVKGATGGVSVATQVWQVGGVEWGEEKCEGLKGGGLFPLESPHNVCWIFADPVHRVVHVFHSSFVPFW